MPSSPRPTAFAISRTSWSPFFETAIRYEPYSVHDAVRQALIPSYQGVIQSREAFHLLSNHSFSMLFWYNLRWASISGPRQFEYRETHY